MTTNDPTEWVKAGSELAESVRQLISPFTDPVLNQLGQYIADKIRFLRFRNSLKAAERANAILSEHGLERHRVSPKVLVPILESAGLEEDEDLIELWACLLASAASGAPVSAAFPAILSQIGPMEVRFLDWLYRELEATRARGDLSPPEARVTSQRAKRELSLPDREFQLVADHLLRLRLVGTGGPHPEHLGTESHTLYDYQELVLTTLGEEFVKACQGPS